MSKLKPGWVKTDIPKDTKIKLWRIMKDNPPYDAWLEGIAKASHDFDEKEDRYIRTSRDTHQRLQQEVMLMPSEEVLSLPSDLQSWMVQIRPDLKEDLELLKRGKTLEALLRERIPEIERLARRIEKITKVPQPNRELLSEDRQSEHKIAELAISGNTYPLISSMATAILYPWWCTSGLVQIRRYLSWKDEALLDRLVNLPLAQRLKVLLDKWEKDADGYLKLKRSGANNREIKQAYLKAEQVSQALHSELWKTLEALR